jgi:uncharacterized DUF497 family protein
MNYKWGSVKQPVDAQKAGEEFERIEKINGMINPATVVEESLPETAVLHPCFEWDDQKASEKWREQQVRVILGNLITVHINSKNEETNIRTFVSVTMQANDLQKSYISINNALNNEDYKKQLLESAKKEFEIFRNKYSELKEFISVYKAYDQTL